MGFEHVEAPIKHSSQTDYSKGFGGKYGVEKQMDKSAVGFNDEHSEVVETNYQRTRADSKTNVKNLKNMFEKGVVTTADDEKFKAVKSERLNKEQQVNMLIRYCLGLVQS